MSGRLTDHRRRLNAHRSSPFIEEIENVGFAEINLHRTTTRSTTVVALEISVDSAERNLDRNALLGPARHQLEGWSDDANQVAVIFFAEIGFDLPAELGHLLCEFWILPSKI